MKKLFFILLLVFTLPIEKLKADEAGLAIGIPSSLMYGLELDENDFADIGLGIGRGLYSYASYRKVYLNRISLDEMKLDWYWSAGIAFSSKFVTPRVAFGVNEELKIEPLSIFGEIIAEPFHLFSIGIAAGIKYKL